MKILASPSACSEPGILDIWVAHGDYELAKIVLKNVGSGLRGQDLAQVVEQGYYDLVIEMLKLKDCRTILKDYTFQEKIIQLLSSGHTCYYAIEML